MSERRNPEIPKYYLDYWRRPYVYRSNRSRPPGVFTRNADTFDIYSLGSNGEDETARGEDGDDIGNG